MSISGDTADRIRSRVQNGDDYSSICSDLGLDVVDVVSTAFNEVDGAETVALDSGDYAVEKSVRHG